MAMEFKLRGELRGHDEDVRPPAISSSQAQMATNLALMNLLHVQAVYMDLLPTLESDSTRGICAGVLAHAHCS